MTSPCSVRRSLAFLIVAASLLAASTPLAAAGTPDDADTPSAIRRRPAAHERRIRTTDRRIRSLVEQAVGVSPSLRALVERIERSDVVVYVQCQRYAGASAAGRLTFVSAAGGLRYVVVRLMRLDSRAQQIALLAHELQHAAEIADTPAIVDGPSLAREYQRFGHVSPLSTPRGMAFDTTAAIEMGQKVFDEIVAAGD